MNRIIKLLSSEADLDAATNVSTASLVRIYNSNTAETLITHKNAAGSTTYGTLRLAIGEVVFVEKAPTDTLICSTSAGDVYATSIAFT